MSPCDDCSDPNPQSTTATPITAQASSEISRRVTPQDCPPRHAQTFSNTA